MEFSARNWIDVIVMGGREENPCPGCGYLSGCVLQSIEGWREGTNRTNPINQNLVALELALHHRSGSSPEKALGLLCCWSEYQPSQRDQHQTMPTRHPCGGFLLAMLGCHS